MRNQSRKSAFTLIELLVTIAIITILAGMLFPAFSSARESARRACCVSNQKQLGMSVMMYTEDYDGRYPIKAFMSGDEMPCPDGNGQCTPNWAIRIFPYTKSIQIFNCPSGNRRWRGDTDTPLDVSYGYNENLQFNNISVIEKPAQTIMMADSDGFTPYLLYQNNYYNGSDTRYISDRHSHGSVLNFTDGHAKWIRINRDSFGNTVPPTAQQGVYWKVDASS